MDLFEYQARDLFESHGVPVLGGAVAFTPAEAGAAAHFVHFDTSPDLSWQIVPQVLPNQYIGASIQLTFR